MEHDDQQQDYEVMLAEAEHLLDEVDHALGRLGQGTYGVCEACGERVDEARLAQLPAARTCARHPQLTDRPL